MAFADWLLVQLNRTNETPRAASMAAGLAHNAITKYLSGTQPTQRSCARLAHHFGVPREEVLQAAGLLTGIDRESWELRQIEAILQQLPPERRKGLVELAQAYAQLHKGR
jgi:hypothetical protein